MKAINQKTLQDLEFPTLIEKVKAYCVTDLGKERCDEIAPYTSPSKAMASLRQTSEYVASFDNENAFPHHYFEPLSYELKLLRVEDSFLEASAFKKIHQLVTTTNELLRFVKKFEEYYPAIAKKSSELSENKEIIQLIDAVIDKYGEVKSTASLDLQNIRQNIKIVSGQINQSFNKALQYYQSMGYLDDIKESIVQNKRVLAVSSMHRRKVKGSVLGQSKTGSIVFIEPQSTLQFSREWEHLQVLEKEEIQRILRKLTAEIQPFTPEIIEFQNYLAFIDILSAKAKYAQIIGGIMPEITKEKTLYFREAYHPILLENNQKAQKKTYPQTIELSDNQRIIVISGPNAGGKSITLKTIGLLQVMLQSGFLIPVHERSKTFFFDRILTDIGDNQSIENHLSTYSYRLKNMNYFLKKVNENTLFLIDEFGTGSDPELGGALAEVFLEEFYAREAYGIITTHYTNLKILANELPEITNANMLFDERTLEPLFQLSLGQAGSSFTFEVAQKNGIPYRLINRAKKKVEGDKIRFDKTIANLQKERSKLFKTNENLKTQQQKAHEESQKMETINQRIQEKLENYQELYDRNQKLISLGQKLDDLAAQYFNNKSKKKLFGELLKVVEIENSKRKKIAPKVQKKIKAKEEKLTQEVQEKIEEIRKEKKEKKHKEQQQQQANKTNFKLKVGDRVRMQDGRAVGTIEAIEKKTAKVNYGLFMSQVPLEQLEMVERKK